MLASLERWTAWGAPPRSPWPYLGAFLVPVGVPAAHLLVPLLLWRRDAADARRAVRVQLVATGVAVALFVGGPTALLLPVLAVADLAWALTQAIHAWEAR